jgi:predicted RNase H-like HicB family nuclease
MYRFLIIIERAERNFSAYCPDLPGCVATGRTKEQAAAKINKVIKLHIKGLREDRLPVPQPPSLAEFIAIPA